MRKRVLVLAVDRDDDIGRVGLNTPIVGEEAVLDAARVFGVVRPEDPDLNVLYAAVNTARSLRAQGFEPIVAVVAGDALDPVKADLRIREQVENIVREHNIEGIVLVADGREDEEVIPVLQGIAPILSVRRVVVEQLRGVEETYILIGRYLKKALIEPRFARVFLGYPGVLITGFAILAMLGLLRYAFTALLLIAGVLMIIRGFGLEERMIEIWARNPIMTLASLIATVSIAAAIGIAYYTLQAMYSKPMHYVLAEILASSAPLIGLAGISVVAARIVSKMLGRDIAVINELVSLLLVIMIVVILYQLSATLRSLTATPTPMELALAIVSSGAMLTVLIGIALIALLRFIGELVTHRTSSPSSSS
ncbi:protein of unknown function DUF373 [Pyrolobus fumarii 1A]|uniref:DUF373 family protein n=1 Tax=Pyrolobus fumarii (strain DSM 11204 / 1A) TaxID=694429 RepID=G0EDL0_PYRF1|nr:DUF373 family protein [Pyrolobus fumarii]AEM39814.1 protein of unknown function DUF373 [Pyrolobus fumarii 1A]